MLRQYLSQQGHLPNPRYPHLASFDYPLCELLAKELDEAEGLRTYFVHGAQQHPRLAFDTIGLV